MDGNARRAAPAWRWKLLWLGLGFALFGLASVAFAALKYAFAEHGGLPAVVTPRQTELSLQQVDPSWIIEGTPIFRGYAFAHSLDGRTHAGIWECVGPAKFRWHFGYDETVYILDGLVNVEYAGTVHTLRPGSVAFFPAGMSAVWHVPERVRKSYTLVQPGLLRRALRRALFSYPTAER